MTEGEMAGWHHRLNGHEFAPSPGDSEAQCSLVGCTPWGLKESGTTERLNVHMRRAWHPTPVFLPGESHRKRSLVGYIVCGSQRVGHD